MSDIERPKYYGALRECFHYFPRFRDDYDCLVDNGFLRPVSEALTETASPAESALPADAAPLVDAIQRCEWLKSKTSLAQYFKWIRAGDKRRIRGGFWCPISRAFDMDKTHLQKLAGRNGNWCKKPESRHFTALKRLVIPYRQKVGRIRKETEVFNEIMKLMNEIKNEKNEITYDVIHGAMRNIKKIICKNCKNVEKNE